MAVSKACVISAILAFGFFFLILFRLRKKLRGSASKDAGGIYKDKGKVKGKEILPPINSLRSKNLGGWHVVPGGVFGLNKTL